MAFQIPESFNLEDRIINDSKEIKKYNDEFNYEFYIPPQEETSMEFELNESQAYIESSKKINKQLESIYVTIYDDDPEKHSKVSFKRIHGRILSGRHRYRQSKKAEVNWKVVYIRINSFDEFMYLWLQFGSGKKTPEIDLELKIQQFCDNLFKSKGITDKSKIARIAVKFFTSNKKYSKSTVYSYIPQDYKNQERVKAGKIKSQKKKSKKDEIIEKLSVEKDDLFRQVIDLKERAEPETKKDLKIKRLENDNLKLLREKNDIKSMYNKLAKETGNTEIK